MHTAKIIENGCAQKNTKRVYDAVMLFNYKDLCYVVLSCICVRIPDSHIIHNRDFTFRTLAVLVATLLAGMKICESCVVATVGLYL